MWRASEHRGEPDRYNYSEVVAGIVRLQRDADEKLSREREVRERTDGGPFAGLVGDFDPNAYFGVLTHLAMDEGYVLDFVYRTNMAGGHPFLYARRSGAVRFATYSDYTRAAGGEGTVWDAFLRRVRADGSPESFFEFVVLRELGYQFYLLRTERHDCRAVMLTAADVDRVLATMARDHGLVGSPSHLPSPDASKDEPTPFHCGPRVSFVDKDTAEVSLVTFSSWEGLVRNTYRVGRAFPHTLTVTQRETLERWAFFPGGGGGIPSRRRLGWASAELPSCWA